MRESQTQEMGSTGKCRIQITVYDCAKTPRGQYEQYPVPGGGALKRSEGHLKTLKAVLSMGHEWCRATL
jgi:hypothetical protein